MVQNENAVVIDCSIAVKGMNLYVILLYLHFS